MIMGLLAAEMTAVMGHDPAELYQQLTRELGEPVYQRLDAPATPEQKSLLAQLSPQQVTATELAGEKITGMLTTAPGDDAPIGGWWVEGHDGERMVCRPPFRDRRYLQDLHGKLQIEGTPRADPGGSQSDRSLRLPLGGGVGGPDKTAGE